MTSVIADILKSKLVNLAWIERFGGMVSQATRPIIVKGPDNVDRVTGQQTYPVACGVNMENCWEGNKFKHFEPDSSKSAIAFFTDNGGVEPVELGGPKMAYMVCRLDIKFLMWLNTKRLGTDITAGGCLPSGRLVPFVMAQFYGEQSPVGLFDGGVEETMFQGLEVTGIRELVKSPEMFAPFTFSRPDNRGLFIFPYDYFGLSIRGTFAINRNCMPEDFGVDWTPSEATCITP